MKGSYRQSLQLEEVVTLLLDRGAPLDRTVFHKGHKWCTPLLRAVERMDVDAGVALELILARGVQVCTEELSRLLPIAASRDASDAVRVLLHYGADPNARSEYATPTLHRLLESRPIFRRGSSKHLSGLTELLDHGADVNAVDEENTTALILASSRGQEDAVRILLQYKAEVHHRSKKYGTALQIAHHRSKDYGTALQISLHRGHKGIVRLLKEAAAQIIVRRLTEAAAQVDSTTQQTVTAQRI